MQLEQLQILRVIVVLLSAFYGATLWADDEPKSSSDEKPKAASDEKPKTFKLSGVFESLDAQEIKADTEHFAALKIKRILPHGSKVTKGQNVVWFETEEIDKKLKDAETDFRLAKLTQEDEEFNYKQFLENQKMDRAAAERTRKRAQQDYDNFAQVDRERQILTADYNLKSYKYSLENAEEELKQLEQMYKEDDLTEESEEIVLKRAKRAVESAKFRLEGMEITSDRMVSQTVPRTQVDQEDTLARAQLAHEKKLHDLSSARRKQDIEIARKRDKFKDEETKLKEMREERKKIVLQSPAAGIFVHGKLNRGKLSEKPSTLDAGSAATGTQILGTVVSASRMQIRIDLKEEDLSKVAVGDKCKIKAKAFPDHDLGGTVKSISAVAYAGSKYDCVVVFKKDKNAPAIMPTMNCELEFKAKGDEAKQAGAKKDDVKKDDTKQAKNAKKAKK